MVISSVFAVLFLHGTAQIEKVGLPLTWNDNPNTIVNNTWRDVPSFDLLSILAEDYTDQEDKVMPFRFAYATAVHYTPSNSGRWTNHVNGDRVWVLGLESVQALSMNLTFGNFDIPQGAKLYVYNEGRTDFVGPITSKSNRPNVELTLLPLKGRKIIVEYYEPYNARGQGDFQIDYVVQGYRDIPALAGMIAPCMRLVHGVGQNKLITDMASSTTMMIVDGGQRITTGSLLNNTVSDGTPLVLTSANSLYGNPESWVFVFGLNSGTCSISDNVECWDQALSGGRVLKVDPSTGLALLELSEKPRTGWGVYYAGWTNTPKPADHYISFQHALGLPLSFSTYAGSSAVADWFGLDVMRVERWGEGNTFPGSIGSPLFNAEGKLIGAFIGGGASCHDDSEDDYYGLISSAWASFEPYLNPAGASKSTMEGFYPIFIENNYTGKEDRKILVFPNPAADFLYFQNETNELIQRVVFTDVTGRMVELSRPDLPILNIDFLPSGVYDVRVYLESSVMSERIIVRR